MEREKELLEKQGIDEKYQDALNKIMQNQQNKMLFYEFILLILLIGFLLNILSSSFYDSIIIGEEMHYRIFSITTYITIIIGLYAIHIFSRYKPKYQVEFGFDHSVDDMLNIFPVTDVLQSLTSGKFTKDHFTSWYEEYKKLLIENSAILITHTFGMEYVEDVDYLLGKRIVFKGNRESVNLMLLIDVIPFGFYREPPTYLTINFSIKWIITNPEVPESDELLSELKLLLPHIFTESMYNVYKTLKPFTK